MLIQIVAIGIGLFSIACGLLLIMATQKTSKRSEDKK